MCAPDQPRSLVLKLLAATAFLGIVACTGEIISPQPAAPAATGLPDQACPTMIPDQATNICPRLKNMTLSCGGNGMLHASIGGGSGSPIRLGATLDNGSVFSAVLVVVNCQDGPREGVTFGVTYTGEVSQAGTAGAAPCIRQSKAVFSQFQFGDPLFSVFEGLAKSKLHETLDEKAVQAYAGKFGFPTPAMPRCTMWRQMP